MLSYSCFGGNRFGFLAAAAWIAISGLSGCNKAGVSLGKVTGKVTLAGAPVPDALVTFNPTAAGSPSTGRTAADGTYKLNFTRKIDGAMVGEHTVTISTYTPALEDPPTPEVPEKIPFKYREGESVPKATVKSGSNKLDFDLENGPIQPTVSKKKAKSADAATCY
jgi:hypothetical protein